MLLHHMKRVGAIARKANNQDGFVLVLTMVMLVVLSVLGVTALNTTNTELSITTNSRMNNNAFVASQLGVEYSKLKVSKEYSDIGETTNYDLINDDANLAALLPAGIELESTGINEIDHYLGADSKRKVSSQSADNTTNTYTTTEAGGSQDTPYYRISLAVKARGRTSSRVEAVLERVANTSL